MKMIGIVLVACFAASAVSVLSNVTITDT